jgi:hypothetical protein
VPVRNQGLVPEPPPDSVRHRRPPVGPQATELTQGARGRSRSGTPPRTVCHIRYLYRYHLRTPRGGVRGTARRAGRRDMPLRFGKWERAYRRCRLWSDTGLWERILSALRSATADAPAKVSL